MTSAAAAAALAAGIAAPAHADTGTFTQSTDITFPDLGYCAPSDGSPLSVVGLAGTTSKVTLHIEDFDSSNPNDVDLLLVSPDGRSLAPLSDAGGLTDVSNLDFDFTDDVATEPSLAGPLTSGTYNPTDYADVNEVMGMGAPDPPYGTDFANFNGVSPNGTWKLYCFADFFNGSGSSEISEWRLTVTTALPELTLKAKKQKLKAKVKFTATSSVDGTLVTTGGVKAKTSPLQAGVATSLKAKLKKSVRKRLAAKLAAGKKAKVALNGTVTDSTGATDTVQIKAKLK